jgi:hypothetical protein
MSSDAYKPPDAPLTEARPGLGKVYSPGQVAGATFLGSPLAGCWLLAQNYAVFGNERARKLALGWGVLGAFAVLAASLALPQRFPNVVVPAAYTVGLHQVARGLQGAQVEEHLAAGGQKHSSWRVVGIGLVCAFLFVAGAIPLVLLTGVGQ